VNDELGDRVVYAPRGRNAEDDLADCILRAAKIFQMEGQLAWIIDGKRVPVFRDVVVELRRRFVVTEHPVRDSKWVVELRPVVPTELTIRNLIRESLPRRAPIVQPEVVKRPQEEPQVLSNPIEAARGAQVAARYAEAGGARTRQEIEAGQRRAAQFGS
jgi:hypothetical protein